MSTWSLIKADAAAAGLNGPRPLVASVVGLAPFWVVALHRVAHSLAAGGFPLLPNLLRATGMVVWGADIWPGAVLGPGVRIAHASGVVIGGAVVAGADLVLFQGATLGGGASYRRGWDSNQPRLGDRVMVLSHTVVSGGIEIGDDVVVGANAVVTDDVPAGRIVRSPSPVVEPR